MTVARPASGKGAFLWLLAATTSSAAFAPVRPFPWHAAFAPHAGGDVAGAARRRAPLYPSRLCMNKKKKRARQRDKKGTARSTFGGTSPPSSRAPRGADGGPALIRPRTSPGFPYAGSLRPGLQTPRRRVPDNIAPPDYALDGLPKHRPPLFPWVIEAKTPDEIEKMRAAGRCAREVLDIGGRAVQPGVTT